MKYVIANWKMHTTVYGAVARFVQIQEGLRRRAERGDPLPIPIVCPPFVSLVPLRALANPNLVRLGAQNCHWENEGPYTGEVSPAMLRGLADFVLLGHSERRAAGDTDEHIARKVAAASGCGMVPIVFIGEDHEEDDALMCTDERLRLALSRIDVPTQKVIIVYEPSWAIGADAPADVRHVQEVVKHLKSRLREMGASSPEVVYGGTVTDDNIVLFSGLGDLDGVGATRAALDAEGFLALVDRVATRRRSEGAGQTRVDSGTASTVEMEGPAISR